MLKTRLGLALHTKSVTDGQTDNGQTKQTQHPLLTREVMASQSGEQLLKSYINVIK